MRSQLVLLACAMGGVIAGASLIAWWVVGVAVIADSLGVAAYALWRDIPDAPPAVHQVTVADVLEKARRSA